MRSSIAFNLLQSLNLLSSSRSSSNGLESSKVYPCLYINTHTHKVKMTGGADFSEEDEVPLSKLIPQVKKDLDNSNKQEATTAGEMVEEKEDSKTDEKDDKDEKEEKTAASTASVALTNETSGTSSKTTEKEESPSSKTKDDDDTDNATATATATDANTKTNTATSSTVSATKSEESDSGKNEKSSSTADTSTSPKQMEVDDVETETKAEDTNDTSTTGTTPSIATNTNTAAVATVSETPAPASDTTTKNNDSTLENEKMNVDIDSKQVTENMEVDGKDDGSNNDDDTAIDSSNLATTETSNDGETIKVESSPKAEEPPKPKPKPVYVPEDWAVEEESDEEEEGTDPFESFKKTNRKTKKRKIKKAVCIRIVQKGDGDNGTTGAKEEKDAGENQKTGLGINNDEDDDVWLDSKKLLFEKEDDAARILEEEYEDSLKFFQEPHEDQDNAFSKFQNDKKKRGLREQLQALDQQDKKGRKQIEIIISELLKSKQLSTDRSVEKFKEKCREEERRDMQKLRAIYSEKNNSNQSKINQGVGVLQKRHQGEAQKLMQQHRHQSAQRRLTEQMAQNEWQNLYHRLKMKQQRQLSDFTNKGEDVKRRCETDYKKDQEKIRKQYEKRLQDVERNRQTIYSRMYQGFQQLRQRYLKRHVQRIMKRKGSLLQALEAIEGEKNPSAAKSKKEPKVMSPRDIVKSSMMEDKVELRPPSPIKTCGNWFKDSTNEKSGAAVRHKHRKGVLSQINKQLSVEIHNEGIWVYQIVEKKEDSDKSSRKDSSDATKSSDEKFFIPWGVKAREVLESIICGEIPTGYGADRFDFGDTVLLNGGHVRCVMTDLRTSDATASAQRASAVHEKDVAEMADLQKTLKAASTVVNETEKNLAKLEKQQKDIMPKLEAAIEDTKSKKMGLQSFRNKFSRYLTPGKCT